MAYFAIATGQSNDLEYCRKLIEIDPAFLKSKSPYYAEEIYQNAIKKRLEKN